MALGFSAATGYGKVINHNWSAAIHDSTKSTTTLDPAKLTVSLGGNEAINQLCNTSLDLMKKVYNCSDMSKLNEREKIRCNNPLKARALDINDTIEETKSALNLIKKKIGSTEKNFMRRHQR